MEIEKHIKNLKDYIRIDKDNINYDDSDFSQFCKSHCEDIQAVLDELNNRNKRIHKLEKNIEFIINKIVNKAKEYQYHTQITAGTNIETNIRQQTLTELLEEIEKEI